MNYNRISVYSQNDFEEKMYKLGLDRFNVGEENDKAFIQIIGTPECLRDYLQTDTTHYFYNANADNVLNLEFDDVNDEIVVYKGVTFKGISPKQATEIAVFIDKHKGKNFYVSCLAGLSRSQAVGLAICDLLGKEYGYYKDKSFRKDNPPRIPNIFVLSEIKKAYYKLKGMEIEL